jgi:hypothetical protein
MPRGATLSYPLDLVLLLQRAATVFVSGFNALYFFRYRSPSGGRRLGAVVLTFVNLAIAAESMAFGLMPAIAFRDLAWLTAGSQIVASSLSLFVVLVIAALIIRQQLRRR